MSVFHILSEKGRDVFTASSNTTLAEIAAILAEKKIGAIVVLADNGKVGGIASERDVVRHIASQGADALSMPVSVCMTEKVVSCREQDSIDVVMRKMTDGRFRHIPVIEKGKLCGIISIGDVVKRKIHEIERDAEELKRYIAS